MSAADRRLSEATLPLEQISLDSVHEKNVRHGHISTLHIWPARRPLAASRAMLLATLLRDPGGRERTALGLRIAGRLVPKRLRDGGEDPDRKETVGGVLRWKRESGPEMERLREEVRAAFGGRAPRVLDPFAGGGAIPLEAMRLGCETFASDLNPVAWFVLRCALHHPRAVGVEERRLPEFALADRGFATALVKSRGARTKVQVRNALAELGHRDGGEVQLSSGLLGGGSGAARAGLAWHVRAWAARVLGAVRREMAARYPTYADFEPVRRKGRRRAGDLLAEAGAGDSAGRRRAPALLEADADGRVPVDGLNADFDAEYLKNGANPRWVAKPVVAYLWARTGECGGCRAEIPLLKTRWLCRKPGKRVLLTMDARDGGVEFGVEADVPAAAGSAAEKRNRDRELGAGTMSGAGAMCPCCGAVATMAELRAAGRAGRLGERLTAVVVAGQRGKEYRLPTDVEVEAARVGENELAELYREIPFGLPDEPTPPADALGMRIPRYGFDRWRTLFTNRQLLALGSFVRAIRAAREEMDGFPEAWRDALAAYLACVLNKFADYGSAVCSWHNGVEAIRNTFARFALPIVWDFCEVNPLASTTGSFPAMAEWVARYVESASAGLAKAPRPTVRAQSALVGTSEQYDVICTDPPYYDAIPYSDLMDFFHVWLRRVLHGLSPATDAAFAAPLGPKWDSKRSDGELIDDGSRFGGDRHASKRNYEDGMARAFMRFHEALRDDGRLVVVFANKSPDAWETLVSALIRSGFVVTGSWPIQTEMQTRQRAMSSAALASSIWLVCRKRPRTARPGWRQLVLARMRKRMVERLHDFWDAGIRGPDFVWAATGPALEHFSRHPVVKRASRPDAVLAVPEFLRHVRRTVAAFVVGRVLKVEEGSPPELDDLTMYYLLHRNDFGLDAAPVGACILYAISCNLSDAELAGRHDLLARGGRGAGDGQISGSEVRLKRWDRRKGKRLGHPYDDGTPPPLIDCAHRAMQLWKKGDQRAVDGYLADRGLWRHDMFPKVVQAVVEMAELGSEERQLAESLQNHLLGSAGTAASPQGSLL